MGHDDSLVRVTIYKHKYINMISKLDEAYIDIVYGRILRPYVLYGLKGFQDWAADLVVVLRLGIL
jgi:hypothetical protein